MRVVWDGDEHTVTTSARDIAAVEKYLDPSVGEADSVNMFRVVHAALLRTEIQVPLDFDVFIDALDDVTVLDAAATPHADDDDDDDDDRVMPGVDPTRPGG